MYAIDLGVNTGCHCEKGSTIVRGWFGFYGTKASLKILPIVTEFNLPSLKVLAVC